MIAGRLCIRVACSAGKVTGDIWSLMDARRGNLKVISSTRAKANDIEVWVQPKSGTTNRRVITVPASTAGILKIGDDCGGLGPNDFVIERIGEKFTDDKGWLMVDVTLAERIEQ